METKICNKCGIEKSLDEFTKDKRRVDGHSNTCKECKRAYDRERYHKIKNDPTFHAKKLEHGAKYRENHKEQIKLYSDDYNSRPEVIERKADWYQNKRSNFSMEDRFKEIIRRVKARAKLKNVPFNLEWTDLVKTDVCPILEIPLNWDMVSEGGRSIDTPSLDRIIPELGYVKGNVRFISNLANMMKSSATKEQIQTFCKNIIPYLESEDIVQTIENNKSIEP